MYPTSLRIQRRTDGTGPSRREVVKQLAVLLAGITAGCTPLRIVLKDYPRAFDEDRDIIEPVLRAFVTTVIPGALFEAPNLVRVYFDPYYPFAPYAGFFASDLCRRAARRFETPEFHRLSLAQRTELVQEALQADATTRRLYGGAILLAQISFYAGIYDDRAGCDLIEFRGARGQLSRDQQTYPDPQRYLAAEITRNGNYA